MKLPGGFNFKKGFTFIELMMVLGILGLLIALSFPLAAGFYRNRTLDVHLNGIVQVLRRAQFKSMSVEDDSSFGVYISPQKYVLFKGNSYNTRDPVFDETFKLPSGFQTTGLSEIVFKRVDGVPLDNGDITLTFGDQSGDININKFGRVNY